MTYGELKNRVLQLAFDYSLAGTAIPATYNNQADYIAMIPGLLNEAQTEIATSHKRIYAQKALSDFSEPSDFGSFLEYAYPADCFEPFTNGLFETRTLMRHMPARYTPQSFLMPQTFPDGLVFEYWRYPEAVSSATADSTELDNTLDVHECLPYYVASRLLLYDDAYRAETLMDEYRQRVAKLRVAVWLEPQPILNRYSGEYN